MTSRHSPRDNRAFNGISHGVHHPRRIILHTTESAVTDGRVIYNFWERQGQGYGAHVVIGVTGKSTQGVAGQYVVWATYMHNTGSLQIEISGFARWRRIDWLNPRKRKQLNEVAKWIAYWSIVWGIPIRFALDHGVAGHRNFPNQTHTDPGSGFPMSYVLTKAREYKRKGWVA